MTEQEIKQELFRSLQFKQEDITIMLLKKDKRFLAVLIAGLILMPMLLPDTILNRLTSIGNTSDTSTSYRIAVWTASINMIKDNYLTGIGLGSDAFGQMYQNYAISGASFALHAHNFYLQWILTMLLKNSYFQNDPHNVVIQ